ncbi:MAG: DsbC family protein [Pseudomonadales bacterium]
MYFTAMSILQRIRLTAVFFSLLITFGWSSAMADPAALKTLNKALEASGLPIESVTVADVPGLYDVKLTDGTVLLTDASGSYFILGDVYQRFNQRLVNLSELKRNAARKQLIDELPESEMVVFSPPPERRKTAVTVFTDIDCGYCRKLHQEVPELNRLGIAVRYLAYPRAGIGSASYDKIVSAWCAPDQKKALTRAKAGTAIKAVSCDNPVKSHFEMGALVGVTGTPSIILEDGRILPGYLPADRLAAELGIEAGG